MESLKETVFTMADTFKTKMSEFQQELQKSSSPATLGSLSAEFNSFKVFMMSALASLQRQVEFLGMEMDRLEMRKRRRMILLHGIEENKSEDTTARVTSLVAEHLDLPNFSSASIKFSHRLGKPSNNKNRPIVVKFTDVAIRDKVWFAKTKLKGTGITQSEFLTKHRHDLFLLTRQRFGIGKCFTREGNIFVIAPDGSRHQVQSALELQEISHSPLKSQESDKADTGSKSAVCTRTTVPRTKRIIKK